MGCRGDFQITDILDVSIYSPSNSADWSSLESELDKLSDDLGEFRDSTTSEESADEFEARLVGFSSLFDVPGGSSQLFGVYEPHSLCGYQQIDPFLTVSLYDFLAEGEGGVIYIDGPNDFSWWCHHLSHQYRGHR